MTVNVLGTEYKVQFKNDDEVCADVHCEVGDCGGYCNEAAKLIVISNLDKCTDSDEDKDVQIKANLRHEIVHAFLNESGLCWNSNATDAWAKNEEMVDWFALQGLKIYKAWAEANAL